MSFVAVAIGGAAVLGLGGAMLSSNAASNAAQDQESAANSASQLQYNEFQQQEANQEPWLQAGQGALSGLQGMEAQGAPNFTMQDFQQDPGYQFDLEQGQQGLERAAAAQGGLSSGGLDKSLANYTQGEASNEYQNAYSRYMNNQNTQFNRLASIAGLGQTANSQLNQAGTAMAGQVGNNMMGAANAQAAGTIGSANAYSGALSGLGGAGNSYLQYSMMNNILNPQGGSMAMPSGAIAGAGNNFGAAPLTMPDMGSQFGGGSAMLSAGGAD